MINLKYYPCYNSICINFLKNSLLKEKKNDLEKKKVMKSDRLLTSLPYHVKEQVLFYKPTNFQSLWSKNKIFPKFLVRPCILTPSEYSFLENPIFIQFIITSKQIVVSFYFFFQEKQTAFANILNPHTLFL